MKHTFLMKHTFAFLIYLLGTSFCYSSTPIYSGVAFHKEREAAKRQALSDLQQTIFVNVESETLSRQSIAGEDIFVATSKLTSTIPLIGATTKCSETKNIFKCEAFLDSQKAANSYESALIHQQNLIDKSWQQTKSISSNSVKYKALANLLNQVHKAQQLALVLSIIAPEKKLSSLDVSRIKINEQMQTLSQRADSLQMLANLLIDKLDYAGQQTLIKPFTPTGSSEITPLASALQTQLKSLMTAVVNQQQAKLILEGKYSDSAEQLNFEVSLINQNGKYVSSAVVSINKEAIKQFDFQPKQLSFDQLLYGGQVVSNDFKVKFQTDKGMRDLLFKESETVRLLIKVNQPAYYYLVGHTITSMTKMSYLLDLQDANDLNKFVKYIGAEDVNHWVEIAAFEVIAPFGQEVLQVFASSTKPFKRLPEVQFDGDYYILQGSITENIVKTRSFRRKKKDTEKQKVAEAVLNITTSNL
jgi:hypothetical protein